MRVVTQLLFLGMVVCATGDTLEWKVGRPTCPSACGKLETTIQLSLKCIKKTRYNPEGSPVASSFCNQYTKPDTNYRCPPTPPCAPRWWTSDVTCPTYCGLLQSQQPRTVLCKGRVEDMIITIPDSYCNQYTKPSSNVTCPATPPCEPYWYTSPVTCPTECGCDASRPPRTVVCKGKVNNVEVVIAESYCPRPKPPPYVQCNATAECVTYQWKESNEQCPTECGKPAKTITHTLTCVAISRSKPLGVVVADSFCGYPKPPVTTLYCLATPPCAPICTANQRPCECDEDCCSGICDLPNTKPSKSNTYGKDNKGNKGKDNKGTKNTKDTKDNTGTCVCRNNGAACTKNAECCYGRCKNYKCAPSRRSFVEASLSHGNAGVALGAGVAVGLGAILAVGVARKRRRLAKIAERTAPAPQVDFIVA